MFGLSKMLTASLGLLTLCPAVFASGLFESEAYSGAKRSLDQRQLIQGTGCATVPVAITVNLVTVLQGTFFLGPNICICAEAGVLTPDSLARLNAQIQLNALATLGQTAITALGGIPVIQNTVVTTATGVLLGTPSSCTYPANSTPVCGTDCPFTCDLPTDKVCGRFCIPVTQGCVSDVPVRRRGLEARNGKFMCPVASEMACLIPALAKKGENELRSRNYECLSIQNDLESCGGCIVPLAGQPAGQDCTAIPNAASVACQQGACVVHACTRGFTLNGTGECEATVKPQGFWDAVKDASKIAVNA